MAAFKGSLVFTVPWSPALQHDDMLLHHCPVWIELPNLPYYLWDQVKEVAGTLGKGLSWPSTPSPSPPSASSAEAIETKSSPEPEAASTSKELVFKGKDKAQETPPSEVKKTPKNIKEDSWKTVQGKKPLNKLGNAAPSKPLQENSNKMSWNVRGLCSLARQMYVKKLIQSEKLDIVMLQETKTGALSLQVKGYACITSKADRGSGGCMTLISNAYKVKEVLQPDCGRWIACQVCIQNEWIGVINVYAPNCPQERKLMWGQLSQIDWDVPLLFAGDWNCEDAELQSNEWIAWKNKFDAVDVASLQGCDALAYPTWTNRHLKSGFVARRLDRIYLSDKGSWVSHKMQGELMYSHTISDHTPIRIQFKCKVERTVSKGPPPPPFKFNISFLREESFCRNMKDAWVSAREGILHPVERWQAGMNAIIKLTKAKGKAQAKAKRRAKCGLEHVLQCTRAAATQSPNDPIVLHLL
ncbi:hypothetical protein L7F22_037915 [Adiantum nelumboides]|nr:hypothetical protein [Adiantum nelumboides]